MGIEVKVGEIYKHFKGNRYEIIALAEDCEDGSIQVVYKALYAPYKTYVRPYFQFIEELDKAKYPYATQKCRFEKEQSGGSAVGSHQFYAKTSVQAEGSAQPKGRVIEPDGEPRYNVSQDTLGEPIGLEGKIDPNLLRFLNGRTYEDQIRMLKDMKGHITEEMFRVMFVSLDFPMPEGTPEEHYNTLMKRLETMSEFDGKRFRE
jgi:hypothetical protein